MIRNPSRLVIQVVQRAFDTDMKYRLPGPLQAFQMVYRLVDNLAIQFQQLAKGSDGFVAVKQPRVLFQNMDQRYGIPIEPALCTKNCQHRSLK